MYVCLCKGVTDSQITQAVAAGAKSIKDLRRDLGVATQCGRCSCVAREMVKELKTQVNATEPFWYVA